MERHFVATGYVVREAKTLLLFHKKLRMWLPPGGHIDEGELPEDAAIREIKEETGLNVEILSPRRTADDAKLGVRHLHIPNHVQLEDIPGNPPHQHIDLIYFCLAKDGKAAISVEEHQGMRWYSLEDIRSAGLREEVRETASQAIRFVEKHRR